MVTKPTLQFWPIVALGSRQPKCRVHKNGLDDVTAGETRGEHSGINIQCEIKMTALLLHCENKTVPEARCITQPIVYVSKPIDILTSL